MLDFILIVLICAVGVTLVLGPFVLAEHKARKFLQKNFK